MKEDKRKDIFVLIMLCLILNLHRFVFSIRYASPGIQTPQDLFSSLYSAAHFAGLNWTDIGKEFSSYYGYGFFSLFSFLFKFCKDGLIIYRIIFLCCQMLTVISVVLAYKIIELFDIKCGKYTKYALCISITAIGYSENNGVVNEYMLTFLVWNVMYILLLLCKINEEDKRKRIRLTVILVLIMIYACTVHARAVAMYPLVIVCVALFGFIYKKSMVNLPVFIGGIALLIPYKVITNYIQVLLLGEINGNSSIISKVAFNTNDVFSVKSYIISLLAYTHEIGVITAGIGIIGIICIAYVLCKKRKKESILDINYLQGGMFLVGGLYSLGGIGGFLLGICFSTRKELFRGLFNHIGVHLRFLTLVRYFMPFVAPFILISVIILLKVSKEYYTKVVNVSFLALLSIQGFFYIIVYPKIKYTGWANSIYVPYTWDKDMQRNEVYLFGILFFCFLFLLSIYFIRKKKWIFLCLVIFINSSFRLIYKEYHQYYFANQMEYVDGGYNYLAKNNEVEDIYVIIDYENKEEEENPADITKYYFLYQLLLPGKHIIPANAADDIDMAYVLTNNPDCVTNNDRYKKIRLDENEWAMIKQ